MLIIRFKISVMNNERHTILSIDTSQLAPTFRLALACVNEESISDAYNVFFLWFLIILQLEILNCVEKTPSHIHYRLWRNLLCLFIFILILKCDLIFQNKRIDDIIHSLTLEKIAFTNLAFSMVLACERDLYIYQTCV